jgi:hypothetical protein
MVTTEILDSVIAEKELGIAAVKPRRRTTK